MQEIEREESKSNEKKSVEVLEISKKKKDFSMVGRTSGCLTS
jgi:hypothetical protein